MISLKVAYNDESEYLVQQLREQLPEKYPLVKLECYHENKLKERSKSFKLKGGYGARKSPFAVLLDSENFPIAAFYSEDNSCTLDKIITALNSYIVYEGTSNQ